METVWERVVTETEESEEGKREGIIAEIRRVGVVVWCPNGWPVTWDDSGAFAVCLWCSVGFVRFSDIPSQRNSDAKPLRGLFAPPPLFNKNCIISAGDSRGAEGHL